MKRLKTYQEPQVRVICIGTAEQLLAESMTAGPTATYMKDPTVSADCVVRGERPVARSVWDDDWSKQ